MVLGGVTIPHETGLMGHSDADVLTHAVIDALLGALGLGDIGRHFPDTDPAYGGADSLMLLARAVEWAEDEGFRLNNLDTVVCAEAPKLAPHVERMRANLSRTLKAPAVRVNVKATTTETLGFCGRREGVAAYAIISMVASEYQGPAHAGRGTPRPAGTGASHGTP